MNEPSRCYIGLGSNLASPEIQLGNALDELGQLADCCLIRSSSLYTSPPMGPADQPDYINAVARLDTALSAEHLLDRLQQIEQSHHRVRRTHWGPRTLDLDILLYAEQIISSPRLQVPHPGMAQRAFVLVPLAEIAGEELVIPQLGRLGDLLERCDLAGLQQMR